MKLPNKEVSGDNDIDNDEASNTAAMTTKKNKTQYPNIKPKVLSHDDDDPKFANSNPKYSDALRCYKIYELSITKKTSSSNPNLCDDVSPASETVVLLVRCAFRSSFTATGTSSKRCPNWFMPRTICSGRISSSGAPEPRTLLRSNSRCSLSVTLLPEQKTAESYAAKKQFAVALS